MPSQQKTSRPRKPYVKKPARIAYESLLDQYIHAANSITLAPRRIFFIERNKKEVKIDSPSYQQEIKSFQNDIEVINAEVRLCKVKVDNWDRYSTIYAESKRKFCPLTTSLLHLFDAEKKVSVASNQFDDDILEVRVCQDIKPIPEVIDLSDGDNIIPSSEKNYYEIETSPNYLEDWEELQIY